MIRTRRASRTQLAAVAACALAGAACARGGDPVAEVPADSRIRTVVYAADEVYRLRGYVGYQIDLEFEAGESFVGLGAGDVESLTFGAQDNHLFLKPRAAGVATNLTIITSRHAYHFEYHASARRPDLTGADSIYVMRFAYPAAAPAPTAGATLEHAFAQAVGARPHNLAYGYRGSPGLKPARAWDDGVQTRLRFGPRQELPAIFVRNEDGSESLVNFSIAADEVTVHRVAREFQLRRGKLTGCIVNEAFSGGGEQLPSGTVAPQIERDARSVAP